VNFLFVNKLFSDFSNKGQISTNYNNKKTNFSLSFPLLIHEMDNIIPIIPIIREIIPIKNIK